MRIIHPVSGEAFIAHVEGDVERGHSSFLAARETFKAILRDRGEYSAALALVALLDAIYGRREAALHEIQGAMELTPVARDPLGGMEFLADRAVVYGWIGERDKAIEQLAAIVTLPGTPAVGSLKLDPVWDPIRDDPRFAPLIAEAAKRISV